MTADTDIRALRGVGDARARALAKIGLTTVGDLLRWFPRAYEDRTHLYTLADAPDDCAVCVRATAANAPRAAHIRKGLDVCRLRIVDESGGCDVTFFNQNYVRNAIKEGREYIFFGRVEGSARRRTMTNPVFEAAEHAGHVTRRIMPVYRSTAGVSSLQLARMAEEALDAVTLPPDPLPDGVRQKYRLAHNSFAVETIHRPESFEELAIARRRLIFEELFFLSAGLSLLKQRRVRLAGPKLTERDFGPFRAALPFALTGAQQRAIQEAAADMTSGYPMNRLLQGDVGSGKTMVAAGCIWLAAQNGLQSALMAPTEILARQHYETLSPLLEGLGVPCALLTGSLRAAERRAVVEAAALGQAGLVIGTHALLTADVTFQNLGLVVTDEQHRFGVAQRDTLSGKGLRPHVLVMSATPIPRTLALLLYGELDVSLLDELPPGRTPVATYLVDESKRERLYAFAEKQIADGRQVFIVCPAVEEGETEDLKNVTDYAKTLQKDVFPHRRVALLHGKMKDKEAVMAAFAAGESDILVCTTVVEVGVDVPNASLMIVENAERFGLSQLHQLRGRVGRGRHQSYCVLVSDHQNPDTRARLRALCATNDGFVIAEEDLKLRGPGDFFGSRQHGLPELHIADLAGDVRVLQEAREAAEALLAEDPELSALENRGVKEHVAALFRNSGERFN